MGCLTKEMGCLIKVMGCLIKEMGCLNNGTRKDAAESTPWAPNVEAVRATIKYTIATGRLDPENQDQHTKLSTSQSC